MRCTSFVLLVFLLSACNSIFQKSEFQCFNKINVKLEYAALIQRDTHAKNHLDDYHNQFYDFYQSGFEKLDNHSNILGSLGKLSNSLWDAKGFMGLETRHKGLQGLYNEDVLGFIDAEIKKINIMIHYSYFERITYYQSTITSELVHPRFFIFENLKKDKLYKKTLTLLIRNYANSR